MQLHRFYIYIIISCLLFTSKVYAQTESFWRFSYIPDTPVTYEIITDLFLVEKVKPKNNLLHIKQSIEFTLTPGNIRDSGDALNYLEYILTINRIQTERKKGAEKQSLDTNTSITFSAPLEQVKLLLNKPIHFHITADGMLMEPVNDLDLLFQHAPLAYTFFSTATLKYVLFHIFLPQNKRLYKSKKLYTPLQLGKPFTNPISLSSEIISFDLKELKALHMATIEPFTAPLEQGSLQLEGKIEGKTIWPKYSPFAIETNLVATFSGNYSNQIENKPIEMHISYQILSHATP